MAETVIFAEQTLTFPLSAGIGELEISPAPFVLTEGETYRVVWDGTEYELVCETKEGFPALGYVVLDENGEGTFGTFRIVYGSPEIIEVDGGAVLVMAISDSETHTLAIYQTAEEDKEYLIWGSTLKAIGNAIREKTGKADAISPSDMPGEIRGITGGGSDVEVVYVTFLNHDGSGEPFVRPVVPGNTCVEPVGAGLMDTPTRESTAEHNFTFSGGWATTPNGGADADVLKNVTADLVVYANFIATVRTYTITYLDEDGSTLHSEILPYGAMPSYEPTRDGYVLGGWTPELAMVTGDANYTATWVAAETIIAQGECGDAAFWKITSAGVMTIYGEGAMKTWSILETVPWKDYASVVTTLVIEEGITTICNNCCWPGATPMPNLTSVTIPEGVTTIGESAFRKCTGLTSITIPKSLVSSSSYAFIDCTALKSVYISDLEAWCGIAWNTNEYSNPLNNGADLYLNGELLTDVVIPDSITTLGNSAFYKCTSLKSVVIPDSVTEMKLRTFYSCTALSSVTIGSGVTAIGMYDFYGCTSLTNITIPAAVTKIDAYAFASSGLTSATFENTSGWWVNTSSTATSGTSVSIANTSTAANYLKDTYQKYYWKRT